MLAAYAETMATKQAVERPVLRHPAGEPAGALDVLRKEKNKARAAVTDPPGFLYPPGAFFAKNRCMDCYELMYVRCPNISRVIGSRSFGGLC